MADDIRHETDETFAERSGPGWCEPSLIDAVCATFGLAETTFEARVPGESVAALVHSVDATLLHPGVVESLPLGSLGFAEYYAMTSSTLREALGRVVRVFRTLAECIDLDFVEEGDRAMFVHREVARPRFSARLAETFFAVVAHRCRIYVGQAFVPIEARFIHPERDAHPELARVLGVVPRFDADYDALVFPREVLDRPLRTADRLASDVLDRTFQDLERRVTRISLPTRVLEALRLALSRGDARLDCVAKTLGLSGRTLQRRLEAEGSSFHTLLEQCRKEQALVLLSDRELPVKAVSHALGYADPSVFFRAFRRWTGTSPAAYRSRAARVSPSTERLAQSG
jgi:AraC-like DNA-binding protein